MAMQTDKQNSEFPKDVEAVDLLSQHFNVFELHKTQITNSCATIYLRLPLAMLRGKTDSVRKHQCARLETLNC